MSILAFLVQRCSCVTDSKCGDKSVTLGNSVDYGKLSGLHKEATNFSVSFTPNINLSDLVVARGRRQAFSGGITNFDD